MAIFINNNDDTIMCGMMINNKLKKIYIIRKVDPISLREKEPTMFFDLSNVYTFDFDGIIISMSIIINLVNVKFILDLLNITNFEFGCMSTFH